MKVQALVVHAAYAVSGATLVSHKRLRRPGCCWGDLKAEARGRLHGVVIGGPRRDLVQLGGGRREVAPDDIAPSQGVYEGLRHAVGLRTRRRRETGTRYNCSAVISDFSTLSPLMVSRSHLIAASGRASFPNCLHAPVRECLNIDC